MHPSIGSPDPYQAWTSTNNTERGSTALPASILVRYDQFPLAEAITCGCLKPRSDPYRNNLPLAISNFLGSLVALWSGPGIHMGQCSRALMRSRVR